MNRYKKTIQSIRYRHHRIVAFSDKIQEAMNLTDNDLKIAFRNGTSWDLPDSYRIEFSKSQSISVLVIVSTSEQRYSVKNPPLKAKQKEFIKLIKKNR